MSDLSTKIGELKNVYTFGSIYLTYIPLNDITHLLNEEKKFDQLVKQTKPEALQDLKTFLNSERQPNMNEALAFVQLDLTVGEAGFKKISDRNGAITKIPWAEPTVHEIGAFCDRFLKRVQDAEESSLAFAAGRTTLRTAWAKLKGLREDPLIPTRRIAVLDKEFRSLVERNAAELEELRSGSNTMYTAIRDFSTKHDDITSALKQQGALKAIRVKIDHIDATRQKTGKANTYYLADAELLQERLKRLTEASRLHLIDLGYQDAVKVEGEDLVDFYQSMSRDKPTSVVTTQPLRRLGFSSDAAFLVLNSLEASKFRR